MEDIQMRKYLALLYTGTESLKRPILRAQKGPRARLFKDTLKTNKIKGSNDNFKKRIGRLLD
jgi:hypothetical protein